MQQFRQLCLYVIRQLDQRFGEQSVWPHTFILRLIGERHGFIYCVETEKMLKQWVLISVGMFQNIIWNGTNKLLPKGHFYYTGKGFEIKVVKQLSKIEGMDKNWIICWEKFWKSSHLSLLKGWLAITSV